MPKSIKELKPIPPNPPRWEPSTDPSSITIPGLDTAASVNDQIDQIDQLITLKLQDIDANFSKMQQVLSNRILPAVKRFAIGTEPVREAAKFWTSFFEHAAQVHIPTSDNLSSMQEPSATSSDAHDVVASTTETSSATTTTPGPSSPTFDLNRTPSESSFLPAHAAVSSTPAAATARAQAANNNNNSTFFTTQPSIADPPSWSSLVESPLVRLDRELREFTRADPQPASSTSTDDVSALPTPTRIRTPHISTTRAVVVNDPTMTTTKHYEDYEEEPTLPVGMSPPVMFPFARLPTLGRSPAKNAAAHIRHTLVRDALRDAGGTSATSGSSAVLSPPSLSRYTRGANASASLTSMGTDPEFDSLMRRVSLFPRDPQSRPHQQQQQQVSSSSATHETVSLMTPPPSSGAAAGVTATPESDDGSASTFSSSGEEDSVHNTAHPSAAFLLASRQRGRNDDDDNDDDEDDSLDADPDAATASFEPVHPFARVVAAGAEDDSFDSLDGDAPEETVFGARPVKRGAALPLRT